MKLFKKLMAGAMAIAMLSAYIVAFAVSSNSGGTPTSAASGSITIEGHYGGKDVFLMKLPTAAANASLTFTVDPKEAIHNSPPSNATSDSSYGTVVFSTVSGNDVTYTNTSEPLKVISMSSMDVTVNMVATLTDTKMTFSTTSGFSGTGENQNHLYLGVQVATLSGGSPVVSGGLTPITALGATDATTLKTVAANFESVISGGTTTTIVSGGSVGATDAETQTNNSNAAADIPDEQWTGVQYTVTGYSNPNADWQIANLQAPNLTIKWVVDKSTDVTYAPGTVSGNNYTAQFDKAKYKAGETATLYVLPKNEEEKLAAATLIYTGANNTGDGKTTDEKSLTIPKTSISTNPTNGVYAATFTWPSDMARPESPVGDVTYKAPTWELDVG